MQAGNQGQGQEPDRSCLDRYGVLRMTSCWVALVIAT